MATTNGVMKSLSEFDFSVQRTYARASHRNFDGYVSLYLKGKKRKNNTRILSFYGLYLKKPDLFNKMDGKVATVAIGVRKRDVLAVFNNDTLGGDNTDVRVYDTKSAISNSMPHVIKLIDSLGYDIPEIPDSGLTIMFNCLPIEGQPHVYIIEPVKIIKTNKDGESKQTILTADVPGVGKSKF